jgi:hypothetical protein
LRSISQICVGLHQIGAGFLDAHILDNLCQAYCSAAAIFTPVRPGTF